MREIDDTQLGGRTRRKMWRNGIRIKTQRWVDYTAPKRIPPKNKGKKRPGVQMRLATARDKDLGILTNFVCIDD